MRFQSYMTVEPFMNMARCAGCGALVLIPDQGVHNTWHDALLRMADEGLHLIDKLAGE